MGENVLDGAGEVGPVEVGCGVGAGVGHIFFWGGRGWWHCDAGFVLVVDIDVVVSQLTNKIISLEVWKR